MISDKQILTVGWPSGESGDILNAYTLKEIENQIIVQWVVKRGKTKWDISKRAEAKIISIDFRPLFINGVLYKNYIGKGSKINITLKSKRGFCKNSGFFSSQIYTTLISDPPPFSSKGGSPHLNKFLRFSNVYSFNSNKIFLHNFRIYIKKLKCIFFFKNFC